MTIAELFVLSEHSLTGIVDQILPEQWEKIMPESISNRKEEITLRKLINYHAYDDAWVPDTLTGKTIAEVGTKYDGDLLGENPKENWHAIVDKAVSAAQSVTDFDKITHLSYGDFPVKDYLLHITMFRAFRTVDLARFLDFDPSLSPELVSGLWELLKPIAEDLRTMHVFGPEVEVPEDAALYNRLLGLSGRQPE